MTFAETLEEFCCECGIEENRAWISDDSGCDITTIGDYSIGQTNSGPAIWHEYDEIYGVEGFDVDGKRHVALYNGLNGSWIGLVEPS